MAISRTDARRLAIDAVGMGARVLRGNLIIEPDGIKVAETDISEWLAHLAGAELMLIAIPIERQGAKEELKSCHTCGRDYEGSHCPYCTEARARLRG